MSWRLISMRNSFEETVKEKENEGSASNTDDSSTGELVNSYIFRVQKILLVLATIGGGTSCPHVKKPMKAQQETQMLALDALRRGLRQVRPIDNQTIVSGYEAACASGYKLVCRPSWHHEDGGNLHEAGEIFEGACESGDLLGCVVAGWASTQTATSEINPESPTVSSGPMFFRKACDGGFGAGCAELGLLYYAGLGVELDDNRAFELFQRACDAGIPYGCCLLGGMYAEGSGVAQDATRAAELFQQGCDGGDAKCCTLSGWAYQNGTGVHVDYARAVELYQWSCTNGYPTGCYHLGNRIQEGIGVTRNVTQAGELYQQACDAGMLYSCGALAHLYLYGNGVRKDVQRAEELALRACEGGYEVFCWDL